MKRIFFYLIALPFALVILFNVYALGSIQYWRAFAPESTAFMLSRMSAIAASDSELQYKWVPYSAISTNLKRALIASEDAKFTSHEGIDWQGIEYAMKKNERKGKIAAGGSTISQQLAKNLFLWEARSYIRKIEETAITFMLEGNVSKQRIFEIYLNVIEWGNGVYGAEAASQYYYDKSANQLTAFQAARLAAMVTKPRYYDDNPKDRGLSRKTNIILARMGQAQIPEATQEQVVPTPKKKRKKRR